jgi:parallel beta-helix repeat protein
MNSSRALTALLVTIASLALVAGCGKDPAKPKITTPTYDYYVDAQAGADANAGTSAAPFKSITHALATAGPGKSIAVLPGTYDAANGESFPIVLQAGQSVTGDVTNKGNGTTPTIVSGHGATPSGPWTHATFVGAEGASLRGLRIGSTYQTLHAAVSAESVAVTVADNTFDGPTYAGVHLTGPGTSHVSGNVFHNGSYGVYLIASTDTSIVENNQFINPSIPIDLASGSAIVRGNRIVGSGQVGIHVQHGIAWIEDNVFDNPGGYATYGAILCNFAEAMPVVRRNTFTCVLGVVINEGLPDLGTAGSPGHNIFTGVSGAAVRHASVEAILAIGNTWQHSPPTAGVDIVITGAGSVRWGTGAGDIYP